jgi:hypothetical protein
MNKIEEIKKLVIHYIASGNINPNDERQIEKFSDLLRELYSQSS